MRQTENLLTKDSSLQSALGAFEQHMKDEGFALNTIKSFASDIRLLNQYIGVGQPIGSIGTQNLNQFLDWLLNERGKPCSPKSYARRVTSIKVFFAWLYKTEKIDQDPAVAVIQRSVVSPMPIIPTETEIDRAITYAREQYLSPNPKNQDARPYLLLTLLLKTGLKKSEGMNIDLNHINRDNISDPFVFIRYKNPRMRYKERKLKLDPEWLEILDSYIEQYQPKERLFTCTARNLEYILHDIAIATDIDKGKISFENLRWFSAYEQFINGVDHESIRQRLGISSITWRETKNKLTQLEETHSTKLL